MACLVSHLQDHEGEVVGDVDSYHSQISAEVTTVEPSLRVLLKAFPTSASALAVTAATRPCLELFESKPS